MRTARSTRARRGRRCVGCSRPACKVSRSAAAPARARRSIRTSCAASSPPWPRRRPGAVPVIAGIIVDSTRDAIRRGQALGDLGVAALQVTPVHYLFRPDDDAMLEHFRAIAEATGLPIVIYNVVPWSYLSPQLLCRILREVPGVVGVKQSAGDLKLLADLLIAAPRGSRIFSAVDVLLYPSFALGAHGSIAAILAAAPHACVELWDAVQGGDHARAHELHRRLLPLWNAMVGDNLPACTKYAQILQGCPGGHPRAPMPPASPVQQRAIRAALA